MVHGIQRCQNAGRHGRHSRPVAGSGAPRGFLSMELVLTLPILGIVLLGLLEFSMLFFARSSIVESSRAGARKGTLLQVAPEDVEAECRKILSPQLQQGLQVEFVPGSRTGDVVLVAVRVPMSAASPDLLWPVGFSLQGRSLYAETRMIKE